jgi:uncharacterized membrane protein YsdA (DUF1294 family)
MPPQMLYAVLLYIFVINLVAFIIMMRDKRLSLRRDNSERIPEGLMFFMATIFGSIGIYAGMFVFRHKIRKWYFVIGIPLLLIQNLAALYLLQTIASGWSS